MPEGRILSGLVVPGMPQLVLGAPSASWKELADAVQRLGHSVRVHKPDVVVIFSTQWFSVLGHLVQADPNPRGVHVDPNWHDLGNLPFDLKVDVDLAVASVRMAEGAGLQARTVNYPGFPMDTGTLVALRLLDPEGLLPVCLIACNIYSGKDEELRLGKAVRDAIHSLGRRAIVVACTGLSGHLAREEVVPERDRIDPKDDQWNRRMLDLLANGRLTEALNLGETYAKETAADMQFKAFYWVLGALGARTRAKVHAYGPLWGGGAAVIDFEGPRHAWVYRAQDAAVSNRS